MVCSGLAARSALAMGLVAGQGCSVSLPARDEPPLLMSVISVSRGAANASDSRLCQVVMDVVVVMPNCGIWGHHDHRREGDTFHFALFAEYSPTSCLGRPYQDDTQICLPGMRVDPPPPPLPPGTYQVVVNGVTGSFIIP